jgi:hypothetical protein
MGACTVTYTTPVRKVSRRLTFRAGTVAPSASYATGGETFSPVVGRSVLAINFEHPAGYIYEYDRTNSKLKIYFADNNAAADSALIEIAASTDLSTTGLTRWSATGTK